MPETPQIRTESVQIETDQEIESKYLEDLDLTWEQLQGKKALELGAVLGRFAHIAKEHGAHVACVESNPAPISWSAPIN